MVNNPDAAVKQAILGADRSRQIVSFSERFLVDLYANDRLHETALKPFSNLASATEYFTRLQLYGRSKSNEDRKTTRNSMEEIAR